MAIPVFTKGYPPDGSSLGQTKSTIRDNLDGTFLTLAVDHVNNNGQPSPNPAGYHTIIHQVPQVNVSAVGGYNQVFSGVPGTLIVNGVTTAAIPANGDTQLYSLTSAGVLSQLSGFNPAQNGFAWAGGILFQWGQIAATSGDPSVLFSPAFPNQLLNVQVTRLRDSSSLGTTFSYWVNTSGYSRTGFQIINNDDHTWTYQWLAIGF